MRGYSGNGRSLCWRETEGKGGSRHFGETESLGVEMKSLLKDFTFAVAVIEVLVITGWYGLGNLSDDDFWIGWYIGIGFLGIHLILRVLWRESNTEV